MPHHQSHHLIAHILHLLAGGGLGLVMASFAQHFGVRSADRLPGETRHPLCLYCMRPSTWQELSPLFGWIMRPDTLAFPCHCGQRRGLWMQPLVEILGLLLGVVGMVLAGWGPHAIPLCLGLGLLPAIAMIDLQFGLIPDGLNILLAVFGVWWVMAGGEDIAASLIVSGSLLAVGLFCALVYSRLRGKEMLGLGDVKFFAAAGLWLQLDTAPWFLGSAGLLGVALGYGWQRLGGGKEFPFAPALCLALAACVVFHAAQLP